MGEQTRINGAAIILAGGEGTRLVGGEYPKALMRLVITPVIEILTDKLLQRDPRLRIYVVTREKWRHDFDRWLEHYERRLNPGLTSPQKPIAESIACVLQKYRVALQAGNF